MMRLIAHILPVMVAAAPAAAQADGTPSAPQVETVERAIVRDAAEYARRYHVSDAQAIVELGLRSSSRPATDRLADEFARRLVGITLDRTPDLRVTVQLTGDEPVGDRLLRIGDATLPLVFRTGFRATQSDLVAAITRYGPDIRASLRRPPGLGVDPRRGEMVILVSDADLAAEGAAMLTERLTTLTGVPVRVERSGEQADMAVAGGARLLGTRDADGRRFVCTSGFAVTDGVRTGLATAAHCPDDLSYAADDGRAVTLPFVSQAGWGYQDVQINAAPASSPLFFADTAKTVVRPVDAVQHRASTRVGDFVCHRGERTGYSCSEVLMTDFAPAGDLCGGACLPTWVAVAGPDCGGGDSGGPVFNGTTAVGLLKGGTYRPDRSCVMYYYMSVDYLPKGWRLLRTTTPAGIDPDGDGEER